MLFLPRNATNRYMSVNDNRCFPIVILNINGVTYLASGRMNPRLTTQDLGKKVSILYREYSHDYSFIINDEQSLADENAGRRRFGSPRTVPVQEHPENGLQRNISSRANQRLKEDNKKSMSLPMRIFGRILEIALYVAIIGGAIYFLVTQFMNFR